MADLDDFFKKKDKKKGKSKKFELKALEQTVSKEKEQNKSNDESNLETTNENDDNDEEWGEFEESKRPDLSNLKLGQLTFDEVHHKQSGGGGADNESESMSQYNNDDEGNENNPWKKAQEQKSNEQKPAAAAVAESKPGVYVPRHIEAAAAAKSRKKNAPDLSSEAYFPSLGTDKQPAEQLKNKKDGFTHVTHGIKKDTQTSSSNFQIPVSSVYSSLFNNEVDS